MSNWNVKMCYKKKICLHLEVVFLLYTSAVHTDKEFWRGKCHLRYSEKIVKGVNNGVNCHALLSMNSHSCTCWCEDLDWLKEVSWSGAQSWAAHHTVYQIKIKYLVEWCYPEVSHVTQMRLHSQTLLQHRNICFLQLKLKATAEQWVGWR